MRRFRSWVMMVLAAGVLAGVLAAVLASAAAQAQAPGWPTPFGPTPGHMTKIDEGLYVYSHSGTNALVMVTADGVIVGDPVNPWAARDMHAKIGELTDQPVRYLFYLGVNHSDGMIFMRPDNGPYLFAVDMVTPGKVPLSYFYDYDISGYVRTMRQLESWPGITTILPGHGPPSAPMAALTERRRYVEALLAAVKAEMLKGTPLPQIIETVELPEFAHMEGYERFRRLNVERILGNWVMGK